MGACYLLPPTHHPRPPRVSRSGGCCRLRLSYPLRRSLWRVQTLVNPLILPASCAWVPGNDAPAHVVTVPATPLTLEPVCGARSERKIPIIIRRYLPDHREDHPSFEDWSIDELIVDRM